ncbi:unnamed protein product [Gongylonema pulchrum]|uniref:Fibrinogen C-terminal domain-containing protein n=1 Tax=Gongylonema pulchrum TaxID=637853 RepID=A0A183EWZ4_9BILA|nr:unnamed protein product [Gongylonema pulchrum]
MIRKQKAERESTRADASLTILSSQCCLLKHECDDNASVDDDDVNDNDIYHCDNSLETMKHGIIWHNWNGIIFKKS